MRFYKNLSFHHISLRSLLISAGVLILIAGGVSVPSAVAVSSTVGKRELPIYCVQTDKPQIALSFDAAWGNEDTAAILDILKRNQIQATFFMTGGWVNSFPEDVKAIAAAGHDLGNHSQNHKEMSKLSADEIKQELMQVHTAVKELTGQDMVLFRPPYGDYNNLLIKTAAACGYYSIQWNVDSLDWKNYGVESIIKTVTTHSNLGNGSIILMHNGAKYTKDALETVIHTLKEAGYEFVPISRLILKDNYHMDVTGKQIQN